MARSTMEIEESGWPDIDERLAASSLAAEKHQLLIRHLTDGLVSHFGVDVVECWVGKDGVQRHSMTEVAAAAVAHLLPALDSIPTSALKELETSGQIGTPIPPPWDDHWRTHPRTATWRS